MPTKPTAIMSNRLYIPVEYIKPYHLKPFTYMLNSEDCSDEYEFFEVDTYRQIQDYYAFARGNLDKIYQVFGDEFEIEDQRSIVPMQYKLSFIGKQDPNNPDNRFQLKEDQIRVSKEYIKKGFGIIKCAPRYGKTITSINIICKLRQKTLIIAHTIDILKQWEDELRNWTNINELERFHKIKLAGILNRYTDNIFPCVTFTTWQTFISPAGSKYLKDNRDTWGMVLVDEVHAANSACYSAVVNKLNPAYRMGVTATPTRKDQLHCIIGDIIGPVVAEGQSKGMTAEVYHMYTNYQVPNFDLWSTLIRRLCKDDKRNEYIVENILKDYDNGRYILATTDRVEHAYEIAEMLIAKRPEIESEIGVFYGGTKDREGMLNDARSGKQRITIAINKLVQMAINVPRWDCFHNLLPMSNKENWYQRISRVRTPMEGKPVPIIRDYIDAGHKAIYSTKSLRDKVMRDPPLSFKFMNENESKYKENKNLKMIFHHKFDSEGEE